MTSQDLLLGAFFFAGAVLYSSVGHAGASAYLAIMALLSVSSLIMKPTALLLNILVASITFVRYYRQRFFSWPALYPFLLGSVPLAFIGGAWQVYGRPYRLIVGCVLLFAAWRLIRKGAHAATTRVGRPSMGIGVLSGAVIGLLSGLTGTGGGIFLSPLLLFMGWAETRETFGVSAAFILGNSIAGLAGNLVSVRSLPSAIWLWALAVAIGAVAGTEIGIRGRIPALRRLLGLVLAIAGLKLILSE